MTDLDELERLAKAATPQDIDGAESNDLLEPGSHIECPTCGGDGCVPREGEYLNYDGVALGVMFYGIGNEVGAAEAYFRAVTPAKILALVAEVRALRRAASTWRARAKDAEDYIDESGA
jgi:hypothetical protein